MSSDPYKYFRVEARELLEVLGQGVLNLEKEPPSAESVAPLLRAAHTLKGAARVVRQIRIAEDAHRLEDLFGQLRDQTSSPSREQIDAALAMLDTIAGCLSDLSPEHPPVNATRPPERPEPLGVARLDLDEVDAVIQGAAEAQAHAGLLRLRVQDAQRIRRLADLAALQVAQMNARAGADSPERSKIAQAVSTLDELRTLVVALHRELGYGVDQLDRETRGLGEAAARLRLVPATALFAFLERAARDAAIASGKRVAFIADGREVRLDSAVLTTIQGALLQLVRNAVAHGIEPDAVRRAAGKPFEGRVSVTVARRGATLVLTCADDGAGIDFAAIRRVLDAGGSAVDPSMDDDALLERLLKGGVTTSPEVSGVAGRGIGLDIVRDAAQRLGGKVAMRTERGRGTTVELLIPASTSSFEALLVEAGGVVAAVPLDALTRTVRVAADEIVATGPRRAIFVDSGTVPLRTLESVVRPAQGGARAATASAAFIVRSADRAVAFAVDRILGTERIVGHPMPALAPSLPAVVGASLDAAGAPRLVLDPAALVDAADVAETATVDSTPPRYPILVIDDSLTTRMLEQSILESAGYVVDVATSGEEGLEKARAGAYSLFLVDVEMPGMDGFTFLEHVRADPALRGVPSILVTSRASAEDRQRGRDAGASGYMVKSDFDQGALLEQIRSLVR